jgi:hypothetical protein
LNEWGLTKELAIRLQGLGIIAYFVFAWLFGSLYFWITANTPSIYFSITDIGITDNGIISVVLFITVIIATLIAHELLHGLFINKYGSKTAYGYGFAHYIMPYFYATPKERCVFTRKQFITILLAPLVGISVIGIVLMLIIPSYAHWLLFPLVMNGAGAIADMWMVRTLLRYPGHIKIIEDNNTTIIYGKEDDKSLNIEPSGFMKIFAENTLKFFLIAISLFIILPIPLAILGVDSFTIGPKDSLFTIFSFACSDHGGSFSLGNTAILSALMLSAFVGIIQTILKAGSTASSK